MQSPPPLEADEEAPEQRYKVYHIPGLGKGLHAEHPGAIEGVLVSCIAVAGCPPLAGDAHPPHARGGRAPQRRRRMQSTRSTQFSRRSLRSESRR